MLSNTSGFYTTAIGQRALYSSTTAYNNTASGYVALYRTTGQSKTASGSAALYSNTTGDGNTASGAGALYSNTTGGYNIELGSSAGASNATGSYNIHIGNSGANESYTTRIGTSGSQTRTFIAGIRGATTASGAVNVVIDANGQLGTVSSSRRFKEDIRDMGQMSARLLDLHPVVYRYRAEAQAGERPLQYGLIAEEVEQVFPELVAYGADGRVETVQYHVLGALLLNELKKQNAMVKAQQAQLATQQARFDEQQKFIAAQQKVLSQMQERMARIEQATTHAALRNGELTETFSLLKVSQTP